MSKARPRRFPHPWVSRFWRTWLLAVALGVAAGSGSARASAQEMSVPVGSQVNLFSMIWNYDRAHDDRIRDRLVVGVAYQSRYRSSLLAKEGFEDAIRAQLGPLVDVVALEVSDPAELAGEISRAGVDVLYVTPLRAFDVRALATVTRAAGVLTMTGVPQYVEDGVSVGLADQGGKPDILINLPASQEEGARFSSQLLKVARLVSGGSPQ